MVSRLSSRTDVIDELLGGGYENDIITTIYGPASAGKTCLSILASISCSLNNKKTIFIDTEGGFSIDRLKQLTPDYAKILEEIIFFKPTTFKEQQLVFERLKTFNLKQFGLIVVDTISMLYRLELGNAEDVYSINRELGKQISWLTEIARKQSIPVLITNQVYSSFEERGKFSMVGGDILKYGSKCLVELRLDKEGERTATLKKHRSIKEEQQINYQIKEKGIFSVKKEVIINDRVIQKD